MHSADNFEYPPRIELARLPTPLEELEKTGRELGVELYIKRDDLTGGGLSGNKVRKLEFVMAEARAKGADTVISCGGVQSNSCRAVAAAAIKTGMASRLLLRLPDPAEIPAMAGNHFLDRLLGAEIQWVSEEDFEDRDRLMEEAAEQIRLAGGRPYIIPLGASDEVGAWGYVRFMEEIKAQLAELPGGLVKPTSLIYACGSGGTGAGLILGRVLHGLPTEVVGVNVAGSRQEYLEIIGGIMARFEERYGPGMDLDLNLDPEQVIDIRDGYYGPGYAVSFPELLVLIRDLARREALILDPVYTGKAFYGMTQELAREPGCFGERIVFIHTGGLYGLLPKAAEFAEIL